MRTVHLCGEQLPHPGHVCAFFDSREQKYDILSPFFKDAIDSGDDIINIVDASDRVQHLATLSQADVPVTEAMRSGQLSVFASEDTYLLEDADNFPRLLEFLKQTLETAKQNGRCLRTAGDMNWIARGQVPIGDVLEYEARVNFLYPDFECTLMCLYDVAKTPATLLADILATHPYAIIQGKLHKNPHYVQPETYLNMLKAQD